jgi:peptidoglycan lytic transglycosylase
MRRIAHGLAVLLAVASLGAGAASGPTSSEAANTRGDVNSPQTQPASSKHKKSSKPYQVGLASWYGEDFDGKATASGEPYDMLDFTAAHLTIPLGTYVRVTNLRNGRSVVVKVNDRGPIVPGRIIDLSYNAARSLNFSARGVQQVRLDLVSSPNQPEVRTVASLR